MIKKYFNTDYKLFRFWMIALGITGYIIMFI